MEGVGGMTCNDNNYDLVFSTMLEYYSVHPLDQSDTCSTHVQNLDYEIGWPRKLGLQLLTEPRHSTFSDLLGMHIHVHL